MDIYVIFYLLRSLRKTMLHVYIYVVAFTETLTWIFRRLVNVLRKL